MTGLCNCRLRSSFVHRYCLAGFFRLFVVLLCAATIFFNVGDAHAESEASIKRHVLILNSYHKGFEWTDAQTSAACKVLTAGIKNLEIYVEYMDTKRLYSEEYLKDLLHIFKLKYANTHLDAIIATDDNALRFAEKHHKTVFRDAPILFCGINDYDKAKFKSMTNCTGLIEVLDIKKTLDLAMQFHPDTKRVFVTVDNTPTGLGQRKDVANVALQYGNLEFVYLKGEDYSFDELLAKLRTLPDNSIVLLTVWLRDKFDAYIPPDEGGALISANSTVPVYGIIDMYLGRGIVGGKLLNSRTHGRMAAEMALRVMHGESPDKIPVVTTSTNPCMFDYKQLKRWGIQVSGLPEDSIVLGKPFSVYDEYRGSIYGIMAAFISLTFLVMILAANINSRKRAEKALTKQKLFTDTVLDAQVDTFFVFDPKSRKAIKWNKALSDVSGFSDEEIAEKNAPNDWYSESDLKLASDKMEQIFNEGQATVELTLITKDGKKIPFEYRSSIIPGFDDEPLYIISVGRDMTERKQTEEERLSLERQVQQAQKLESLGVLAGGIAHDFNNILVAVLGYADLALKDLSPHSPVRDYIEEIENGARRAADLSTQMLAYSGKGRFELRMIDLSEFVEEIIHLLEVSVSKKAILKFNFAKNLPPTEGDATQIRQVIMNLLTNASEAIGDKSGVICISTGAMECDAAYLQDICINEPLPEGMYVYLEIADTGCGMDKETQSRIFDPFFTTKFTGRGLGLAALLGIVRGHKGSVKIYSEPEKGTTIKILFPASHKYTERLDDTISDEITEKSWVPSGKILLVDDEDTVRALGKRMLERIGFEVLLATDGREAVEVFKKNPDEIACVLLDLTMPHMDGEECFRELRRIKKDVQVIISSGYSECDVTLRFSGKGMAEFIQKPYLFDTLKTKILSVLQN